jgi:hypothetical protein
MIGPIDGTARMDLILEKSSIAVDLLESDDLDQGDSYKIKQAIRQQILADAVRELASEGSEIPGRVATCKVRLNDEN